LGSFMGIANSFDQYPREWHHWFTSDSPETFPLPGEWENSCNELQRMLVVRSLRPDRVPQTVTSFVINNLGAKSVSLTCHIKSLYFVLKKLRSKNFVHGRHVQYVCISLNRSPGI
jgi:hypothetical protein